MTIDLQTLLGIIFGVGGVGAITVLVTSYRRLKVGKINDEESIIKRVHRELERAEKRADIAEEERDREVHEKQHWREQAWTYRLQLMQSQVTPDDIPDKKASDV